MYKILEKKVWLSEDPAINEFVLDAPDIDRGCRTKITVKVDGDVEQLWKNWSSGLHRQTCYGDVTKEMGFFCKFKEIEMVNEAV